MTTTLSHRLAIIALALAGLAPVAASAAPIPGRFSLSADGLEVTDLATGLIWRRCAEGQIFDAGRCLYDAIPFSPQDAQYQAISEAEMTGVAWRLPNVKELASLIDLSRSPAVDPVAFPDTPESFHWSSTPFTAGKTRYWGVFFKVGGLGNQGQIYSYPIRLVRAGR
jgi:hypothetical protein